MTSLFWLPLFMLCLFEMLHWKAQLLHAIDQRLARFEALKNTLHLAPFLRPLPKTEDTLAREAIWLYLQTKYPEAAWAIPEWALGRQGFFVSFYFQGKHQMACWKSGKKRWGSNCGQSLLSTLLCLSLWTLSTLWFLSQYKSLNQQLEVLWHRWSLP